MKFIVVLLAVGFALSVRSAVPLEQLTIFVDRSSLEVMDAPGTNVTVEVFRLTNGKASPVKNFENFQLSRETDGLVLHLSPKNVPGLVFLVQVPTDWPLSLRTSHGDIAVRSHEGSLQVKASVGKVELGRMLGDVNVEASGGDVWLERGEAAVRVKTSGGKMMVGDLSGPAVLESSGGSIHVIRARSEVIATASGGSISVLNAQDTARLEAIGGSVAINFTAQPKDECVLRSSGGVITLGLLPQLNLRLAARGGGDVNTDLPIDWREPREHYQRGLLNTNVGTITARADGGAVTILNFKNTPVPAHVLFKVNPVITELTSESTPMQLVAPRATLAPRGIKWAVKDVPRIERDEGVWENADWKPVTLLPKGVVLRNGTWIEAEIMALSAFQVRYRKADGAEEISKLSQVSAILFESVPDTRRERIEAGRRGVLLRAGDFFEGEFSELDSDQVTLSSVLFGTRKFSLKKDVSALVLRGE